MKEVEQAYAEVKEVREENAEKSAAAETLTIPEDRENSAGDNPDESDIVIAESVMESSPGADPAAALKAIVEAAIYITDDPLTPEQIASALDQPMDRVISILQQLTAEYAAPDRGLAVRELAGGYKMGTKPEHHESIRLFVKKLQPPLKLSLAARETLALVAYKQPITAPEIMEIRGTQGAGVLKTLLDRKLIAQAGRKNVVGKPMMYKTTREFLIQFGLSSLSELPTLKEFEELGRLALNDSDENTPGGNTSTESGSRREGHAGEDQLMAGVDDTPGEIPVVESLDQTQKHESDG